MTATAQEVFTETVRALPPSEQFRLATLILQELAQSEVVVVERSDTWSEQDQNALARLYPKKMTAVRAVPSIDGVESSLRSRSLSWDRCHRL